MRRQTYLHNFYEEAVFELCSFGKEKGKHPFGIEKPDVEGYLRRSFPGFCAWWMNGREIGRSLSEKHLGGSCPGKALVGPDVREKEEPSFEPSLEVLLKKRPEGAKAQCVFELFPESFNDGNGAGFSDGTEPLSDPEAKEKLSESGVDELASLVGNEMSGDSEANHGLEKKDSDVFGGWLFGENAERERQSRKDIQDDCDFEAKKTKESGNFGEVGHPDVSWVTGLDGACGRSVCFGSFDAYRRLFSTNSTDGFR